MNGILCVISVLPLVFIVCIAMCFRCNKNYDSYNTEEIESINDPLVSVEPIVVDNSVIYSQATNGIGLLLPAQMPSNGPIIVKDSELPANMRLEPENFPSVNVMVCSLDSNTS